MNVVPLVISCTQLETSMHCDSTTAKKKGLIGKSPFTLLLFMINVCFLLLILIPPNSLQSLFSIRLSIASLI